jgi:hypothetical protein
MKPLTPKMMCGIILPDLIFYKFTITKLYIMAILSYEEYMNYWTDPAPHGFGQIIAPPCYHEYVQREIYFQDYLDLYTGILTFERTPSPVGGVEFYVQITGNPILVALGIPPHPTLILAHGGNEYLLVDYDYPWIAELANANNRCIKYLMIAEAAPIQNPRIVAYGVNDNMNSYFYNYRHTKSTQYFSAPCAAFHIPAGPKINRLIQLANNGVLLLDLFPFAINYNGFREYLNNSKISNNFFNGLHPYSILNRMANMVADERLIENGLEANLNAVFIAPPGVSHYLGGLINNGLIIPNLSFRLELNTFLPPHTIRTPLFYDEIPVNTSLIGGAAVSYSMTGLTKSPIYACCAYNGRGDGAHATFIKNALGL